MSLLVSTHHPKGFFHPQFCKKAIFSSILLAFMALGPHCGLHNSTGTTFYIQTITLLMLIAICPFGHECLWIGSGWPSNVLNILFAVWPHAQFPSWTLTQKTKITEVTSAKKIPSNSSNKNKRCLFLHQAQDIKSTRWSWITIFCDCDHICTLRIQKSKYTNTNT